MTCMSEANLRTVFFPGLDFFQVTPQMLACTLQRLQKKYGSTKYTSVGWIAVVVAPITPFGSAQFS